MSDLTGKPSFKTGEFSFAAAIPFAAGLWALFSSESDAVKIAVIAAGTLAGGCFILGRSWQKAKAAETEQAVLLKQANARVDRIRSERNTATNLVRVKDDRIAELEADLAERDAYIDEWAPKTKRPTTP